MSGFSDNNFIHAGIIPNPAARDAEVYIYIQYCFTNLSWRFHNYFAFLVCFFYI